MDEICSIFQSGCDAAFSVKRTVFCRSNSLLKSEYLRFGCKISAQQFSFGKLKIKVNNSVVVFLGTFDVFVRLLINS